MPQVLIRDLDATVIEGLKERAKQQGRSLEAELRLILQQASCERTQQPKLSIAQIQAMFAGQTFSDSGELQREDRER